MKVKLLKKLRKEVKEKYILRTQGDGVYYVAELIWLSYGTLEIRIDGQTFESLTKAIEHLNEVRRKKILNKLHIRYGNKRMERLNKELSKY